MKTKSKNYVKPEVLIVQMKMNTLLAGSYTEDTSSATGQSSGSFNARSARFSDWDESDED